MKRHAIMSDVQLSYEELRCLEAHFRDMQKKAVVYTLKHSPANTAALVKKLIPQFGSVEVISKR